MTADFDLAIVGSGFGGSLLAMVARKLGLSVLLIERGKHPRFAVGESTSPLTNLILEQIARRYDLPRLLPLTTFGEWQRAYPQIGCGLKRGFTYYKHDEGSDFRTRADRANELLVAASPSNEVSDTHWLRADVDGFLAQEAITLGADYLDETEAELIEASEDGATLILSRHGSSVRASCRLLIDASGPRGFLHRAFGLKECEFKSFPSTQALFSHFAGVRRTDTMEQFQSDERPPYPPDDAALHHVFDDGWMWVLRFGNGITSAGVSLTVRGASALQLKDGAPAWDRLMARYPTVRDQFDGAEPIRPFIFTPRLSYRSFAAAGPGWTMLPSAAAFVDPLFSTGIVLTLIGIERIGLILEDHWGRKELGKSLAEYSELTLSDADWTAEFVGGCFAGMRQFELFTAFSMYYFAAASFSEMARRIGRRDLASRFLMQNRPDFAAGLRAGVQWLHGMECAWAAAQMSQFFSSVAASVRSTNVAGIADMRKRNWYDIEWSDLIDNARYLELTPSAMRRLLTEAAWAPYPPHG